MNIRSFVITTLIVLFAVFHSGSSEEAAKNITKCYKCDSRKNDTCVSKPTSVDQEQCSPNLNCGKCDYEWLNNTKFVIRGCGMPVSLPPSVELNNGACTFCKGDLCNNANMATISMTAFGCLVSFWAIRSILTNSY